MATRHTMLTTLLCLYEFEITLSSSRPNILFVLIDDLGWNDVSYHGGSDFETPNINALAGDALELTHYYVQHYCTPTRSALMSGRYPMRDGLQQYIIQMMAAYGMPLDVPTIPQHLKTAGYSTHLIGKWHLGFFDPAYTPTNRGFDSFLGYYGGFEDYYSKNVSEKANLDFNNPEVGGYDFRKDTTAWVSYEYSTYLYGNETLRIMQQHVTEQKENPFFILLSSQAAHTPYDAPQEYLDRYSSLNDANRQEMAAVLAVLDETLGDITDYLQSEQGGYLWNNTMVIISADNGGSVTEGHSNFPLRGGKRTLWEGGMRATAFITGGWLPDERRGQEMNALMHVTDWLPTLVSIAGFEVDDQNKIDGYDQSSNIRDGVEDMFSPREYILHNVLPQGVAADDSESSCYDSFCGAIRYRQYKLVIGGDDVMNASSSYPCDNQWCDNAVVDNPSHSIQCSEGGNYEYPSISEDDCLFNGAACLFNILEDPCEWNDIAADHSEMVEMLMDKLTEYNNSQMYPLYRKYLEDDTVSNPELFNGFWSPWKNVEAILHTSSPSRWTWKWTVIVIVVISVGVIGALIAAYFIRKCRRGMRNDGYKRIDAPIVSTIQSSTM